MRKSAFTLIELLVVIAIISILAAMLLPTLEEGIEQARRITCANQIHQLHLAAMAYGLENNDRLPAIWSRYCDTYYGRLGRGDWGDYTIRKDFQNYVDLYLNTGTPIGPKANTITPIPTLQCPSADRRKPGNPAALSHLGYAFVGFGQWMYQDEKRHGTTNITALARRKNGYPTAFLHDVLLGPERAGIVHNEQNPQGGYFNHNVEGGNVATVGGDVQWVGAEFWRTSSWGNDWCRAPSLQYTSFHSYFRWISPNNDQLWLYHPPGGSSSKDRTNNRYFGYTP